MTKTKIPFTGVAFSDFAAGFQSRDANFWLKVVDFWDAELKYFYAKRVEVAALGDVTCLAYVDANIKRIEALGEKLAAVRHG